jgi:enoyl-CoA hydratase
MSTAAVIATRSNAPGVLVLTLNRPDRANALNKALLMALEVALAQAEADDGIRCVVITGAGERAFCAGADITEQQGFSSDQAYAHMRWGQDIFLRLENFSKPTLAAINGFALGGGLELALACDFRTASDCAQLGFPEVTLANLPGWGGTQRLPRLIGTSNAKLMAMTGTRISVERALASGLVNFVYPATRFWEQSVAVAAEIASRPLDSLRAIKQVMRDGIESSLSAGMEMEARAVARLWGSPAQKEAQHAFFSRRAAGGNT